MPDTDESYVASRYREADRRGRTERAALCVELPLVRPRRPTETVRMHAPNEGIRQGVEVVGDVMYDMLQQSRLRREDRARALLPRLGLRPQEYVLVTVHRAGNTDDPEAMRNIASALNKLPMPAIFPVHPRTHACLSRYGITWKGHVHLIEPVGYIDMLALESSAYRILTDSGGVQKEAFLLGVPCVTLRAETEWPETLESGWNVLVGSCCQAMLDAAGRSTPMPVQQNPFGDGHAAMRIAQSF
jgi:UDP-GlcNAc3NAcA epimerase